MPPDLGKLAIINDIGTKSTLQILPDKKNEYNFKYRVQKYLFLRFFDIFSNFSLKLDFNVTCDDADAKNYSTPMDKIISNLITRYLNGFDMEYRDKTPEEKRRDCLNSSQILLHENYATFLDVVKHSQIGLNFMKSKIFLASFIIFLFFTFTKICMQAINFPTENVNFERY